MKAIILAAGKGERLKSITPGIPKPMLLYKNKPILQHNIELCKKFGIREIYINTHHLAEKISGYFGNGKDFGVSIKYSNEKNLLGTAGAVKKIANDFWDTPILQHPHAGSPAEMHGRQGSNVPTPRLSEPFFVIYGDNFTRIDLKVMIEIMESKNASAVIALHYREDISSSGVAEMDDDNRILKFIEKPGQSDTKSRWVNAGIYLMKSEILALISEKFSDFGKDILPLLIQNGHVIYGVKTEEQVLAFDTPELLNKNLK